VSLSEHEIGLTAFLHPTQARRAKSLLENGAKGRKKLLAMFDHDLDFDRSDNFLVGSGFDSAQAICDRLIGLGASGNCYVMSVDRELDAQSMTLERAIQSCYASGMGTFVSCIPGRLGYFEGEDAGYRFVLQNGGNP
jgi:hypothetical protein